MRVRVEIESKGKNKSLDWKNDSCQACFLVFVYFNFCLIFGFCFDLGDQAHSGVITEMVLKMS